MKQNIFDDERFYSAYSEYRKSPKCLNTVIEQPALSRMLPDLRGARVLDIGCGAGSFCNFALNKDAEFVLGVDISRRMCAQAETLLGGDRRVGIVNQPIEDFRWQGEPFDVIVSSLALHYVEPLSDVVQRISSWLPQGGIFIVSVNHPIYTAGLRMDRSGDFSNIKNYWDEGPRPHTWFVEGVVKYHRTMETYFQLFNSSGLRLKELNELSPQSLGAGEWVGDPNLTERPIFILIKAVKDSC